MNKKNVEDGAYKYLTENAIKLLGLNENLQIEATSDEETLQ